MARRFWVVLCVLLVAVGGIAFPLQRNMLDTIRARGVLRIGEDAAFMPFYGTDKNGNRIGFDADLARDMAKVLGVKVKFVVTDWGGILLSLNNGDFDIIISGMTITPKRALMANFTIPYFSVNQTMILNKKRFPTPPTIEELQSTQNLTISVQLGTTGEFAARRFFPKARILTFDTMDEAAFQVATSRVDLMVADSTYSKFIAKKYPQSVYTTGQTLTSEELGMAVKMGDPDFLNWLNTFIRCEKASGRWDELYKKWFVEYSGS